MANTSEIEEAKARAQELKSKINQIKGTKGNGTMDDVGEKGPELGMIPKVRRILKGHFGKVYAMHWAGDSSNRLVSASQDGKLIIWNGFTTNKVQAIPLRSSWVMTCAFEGKDGNQVACGGLDNLCSIYELGQTAVMRASTELAAHDGYLSCCRFVNPQQIITSSGDSTCILWDIEQSEPKVNFTDHAGDVMGISINPQDPQQFVSGSCDATAKVWDTRTGKCTHTLKGHESDINSVMFLPNGAAFATGSDDATCRLFDVRAYSEINLFGNDKILSGITSVSFSNSGRLLFAGYDDYNCYVWETTKDGTVSGSPAWWQCLTGHENRVSCLGTNPLGTAMCTGSWDTLLKIWAGN